MCRFHLNALQSIQQTHTALMFIAFKNRPLWKSSNIRCFLFFLLLYSKWHISMKLWLPGAEEKESNLMTYWSFLYRFLCYTCPSAWVAPCDVNLRESDAKITVNCSMAGGQRALLWACQCVWAESLLFSCTQLEVDLLDWQVAFEKSVCIFNEAKTAQI